MKRAHLTAALAGIALLACQDQQLPTAPDIGAPSFAIMDGNTNGGNPGFFFLWPIRTLAQENSVPSVGFDPTRLADIQVQICRLPGCVLVQTLTMAPDPTAGSSTVNRIFVFPEQQEYAALWVARNLDLGTSHRIRVLVGGQELGFADVDIRARLREVLTYDDRQNFVPLLKAHGYTALPIRFWIGNDALDVNDAPTLDPISDPAPIPQGAGLQTVNLSGITAGPGESQTLTVTATSGNTALVPHPTVNYTSPSSTGSLQYTPVATQSGSAIITVTVQDDGGTANGGVNTTSRTFTVTVTPPVVTTVRWINPNGGDWNTASNWSTGALPTATQDVIIDIAVANPVTHSAGTTQINSLTSNQPTSLAGGALVISGTLQLSNAAGSIGASVTAGGSITLGDPGTLTIGSNINAGTNPLTITAGGAINQGAGTVTAGLLALNAGAGIDMGNVAVTSLMISSGTGAVSIADAGGVTLTSVAVHGTLNLLTTGSLVLNGNVTSGANTAILSATGGAITQTGGTLTAGALGLNAGSGINLTATAIDALQAANAAGAVSVVDATPNLNILGTGVTNGGNVTLATQGTLTLTSNVTATGSTATLTCGTAIQAGGTVNATSLVLNTTAGATLANLNVMNLTATNTTSGALSLSATGSLTVIAVANPTGHITLSAPGNLTLSGNVNAGANTVALASNAGAVHQTGGSITAGTLRLDAFSGISLLAGSVANLQAANATSGDISIALTGSLKVALGGVTNNAASGNITLATTGVLTLEADVTVQPGRTVWLSGATISSIGGEPVSQTLLLTSVNNMTLSNLVATELSAVSTGAGSIVLSTLGDVTIVGPGLSSANGSYSLSATDVTIASGVNVSGTGTIVAGELLNRGNLILGAGDQATVSGDFANAGVVRVGIGGSAQFGRLTISGAASLAGTLDVLLVGSFVPVAGDRFQFMNFGSRTGFFTTTNLPPNFTVDQSDPVDLELVAGP